MSESQKRVIRNSFVRLEMLLKLVQDSASRDKLLEELQAEKTVVYRAIQEDVQAN